MADADDDRFVVTEENAKHHVRAPDGRTLMTCGDARSAQHYATMLSSAYRQGFKAGYRAAKTND